MYIALLGRQPELSIAELERLYGAVSWFSATTALIDTDTPIDVQHLGGTQKLGRVVLESDTTDWRRISEAIVRYYSREWAKHSGKITVGLSAYDLPVSARELQKTGILLKSKLKQSGVSLRLIPNNEAALSTATSHHNKLGLADNKVELLIVRGKDGVLIAESTGSQNITALAARDQGRPRRDAFVGMLPPKLAQLMINLAGPLKAPSEERADETGVSLPRILDPFCGTGVVLQEALLHRYAAYGTDLAEKMIRYSRDNLNWLQDTYKLHGDWYLHEGDAIDTQWQQPIDAVVCEAYLGQPFSAPPSPKKLEEVRGNCNHIIGQFLTNLSKQLPSGTPLVVAVPAWRNAQGELTHLPLTTKIGTYGFTRVSFKTVESDKLAYFRPDQIVARELLVLTRQ